MTQPLATPSPVPTTTSTSIDWGAKLTSIQSQVDEWAGFVEEFGGAFNPAAPAVAFAVDKIYSIVTRLASSHKALTGEPLDESKIKYEELLP